MSIQRWLPCMAGMLALAMGMAGVAAAEEASPGSLRAGIFGLEARGQRIVYVFDRSASMGESAGRRLEVAKGELLRSLDALGEVQQFYILFYNHRPLLFSPSGLRGRLVFATEQNRQAARRFVESVRADGGTRHAEALTAAFRLQPDVVFLLTDAEEKDDLTAAELERLTRQSGAARCMIVQFGDHDATAPRLAALATATGGRSLLLAVPEANPADPRESLP